MPVPADPAPARRAVVLTAIPVEYAAVRAQLRDPREVVHPSGTVYEVGTVGSGPDAWTVAVAEVGAGNDAAALEAERAIEHFGATHALFVGVAGGLKDVGLGDVVAATKVYGYESGKAGKTFRPRPEVGQSSHDLVQRARVVRRTPAWAPRIAAGSAVPTAPPAAYVAPIAAGAKVVAARRSDAAHFLRTHYGDALAVEMEGAGFLRAAHARPGVRALVVRGISDLVDGKSDADAAGWQVVAAHHAAAFAFAVLAGLAGASPAAADAADAAEADGDAHPAPGPSGRAPARGDGAPAGVSAGDPVVPAVAVAPSEDVDVHRLLATLYPSGPRERDVWERAGGDPAALESGVAGVSAWFRALRLARLGGGGTTLGRLLDVVGHDFPNNPDLARLRAT